MFIYEITLERTVEVTERATAWVNATCMASAMEQAPDNVFEWLSIESKQTGGPYVIQAEKVS